MTRLLISVRNVAEAERAADCGADLIDVKEPSRGALGAADRLNIQAIADRFAGRIPISVALGELIDWPPPAASPLPAGIDFAKIGLAGCGNCVDWLLSWRKALSSLPPNVGRVGVVYADWQTAAAPAPEEVLAAASELGCAAILVDTYAKTRGGLFDLWSLADLTRFVSDVRAARMLVALAGSLTYESIPQALALKPDLVAVRGAACSGGRCGAIDVARAGRLAALVAGRDGRAFDHTVRSANEWQSTPR